MQRPEHRRVVIDRYQSAPGARGVTSGRSLRIDVEECSLDAVIPAPRKRPAGNPDIALPGPQLLHTGGERRPAADHGQRRALLLLRSEEHTSELQSLMRTSYAVFCLKKKN